MKKLYVGIIFGVFALASFVTMNLVTSTQFPGYGENETCNNCHNQPALVKTVDVSFGMSDFTAAYNAFSQNGIWSTDYVPTIPTNDRNSSLIEFVRMTFLKNSTDVMVFAQVPDSTPTTKGTAAASSDKFGIIFNIDVVNFTVGDFLTAYNGVDNITGQMAFPNGHADFWYLDIGKLGTNTTGMALDEYISNGPAGYSAISSTNDAQDIHVGVWYGDLGHGSVGYRIYMVRPIDTKDSNDAQFNNNGQTMHYAIAAWNDVATDAHHSSFDQMVIVGNQFNVVKTTTSLETTTATTTKTETTSKTSSTTSSFTAVFVLAALAVSIPLIGHMRKRKN